MPLIQRLVYLLNARSIFDIFLRNWMQFVDGFSLYNKGMLEKATTQNPATVGFFYIIERTQLNAAHAQLLKKLRRAHF